MKDVLSKSWLSLCIILAIQTISFGQDYQSALGVRLGRPALGATYKFTITDDGAMDVRAGFRSSLLSNVRWRSMEIAAIYKHHFSLSEVTNGLYFFLGGGPSLNIYQYNNNVIFDDFPSISLGLRASLGLDYTPPETPINFGIDWAPGFIFKNVPGGGSLFYGGLSVRYILRE